MGIYYKLALFVGGALFGSFGVKLLTSRDAKKVYSHTTAAVLRAKDFVAGTVTAVQENAADILEEAKDINAQRVCQADEAEAEIPDASTALS